MMGAPGSIRGLVKELPDLVEAVVDGDIPVQRGSSKPKMGELGEAARDDSNESS